MNKTTIDAMYDKCQDLISNGYRNGFNDSTLTHISNVAEEMEGKYREVWNDLCNVTPSSKMRWDAAVEKYGFEFMSKFYESEVEAAKEGCFVMPDWGTRGT